MKAGRLAKIASLKISIWFVVMYVIFQSYIYTHTPYCLSYLTKTIVKVIRYNTVLKYTDKKIITNFADI